MKPYSFVGIKSGLPALFRLICFQVLMVLPCTLYAQNIPAVSKEDILFQRIEVFNQIKAMDDPFEDSLWYQGRIYEFEVKSHTGTPYYFNAGTLSGSVSYNGKWYEDLILSYNLILDELVLWKTGSPGNRVPLVLNKYYVERFTLMHYGNEYHFRLHSETNPIHEQLKEGFYEVVYEEELSMFVKHQKELNLDPNSANQSSYRYDKQVYLILDGKVYTVDGRRDYLKAFQDDKKFLRKHMRQAKINFEKSGTQILIDLCAYSRSLLEH